MRSILKRSRSRSRFWKWSRSQWRSRSINWSWSFTQKIVIFPQPCLWIIRRRHLLSLDHRPSSVRVLVPGRQLTKPGAGTPKNHRSRSRAIFPQSFPKSAFYVDKSLKIVIERKSSRLYASGRGDGWAQTAARPTKQMKNWESNKIQGLLPHQVKSNFESLSSLVCLLQSSSFNRKGGY